MTRPELLERYRTLPLPTTKDEHWRFTDLAGFDPDGWEPDAPDAYAEWEDSHDLGLLIADLPERQREVADLLYREGLSPEQIAERLGIKRNAVDQALHNAHRKLAEKLRA